MLSQEPLSKPKSAMLNGEREMNPVAMTQSIFGKILAYPKIKPVTFPSHIQHPEQLWLGTIFGKDAFYHTLFIFLKKQIQSVTVSKILQFEQV